jgi:hypothetical protein
MPSTDYTDNMLSSVTLNCHNFFISIHNCTIFCESNERNNIKPYIKFQHRDNIFYDE